MYRRELPEQTKLPFPYNVELNPESKWVKLADLIPWSRIEEDYVKHFRGNEGQVAKPARLAFGALYIQATEGFTDEKTAEHIQENPHMQYFCGLKCYAPLPAFDASMMVHFRKRIPAEMIIQITKEIFAAEALKEMEAPEEKMLEEGLLEEILTEDELPEETGSELNGGDEAIEEAEPKGGKTNRGTLILDATCCPQDIRFPTDIGLLNQARELLERIIDMLFADVIDLYAYKPRTYRQVARKDFLNYSKARKRSKKFILKHKRKQLQYIARDLRIIKELVAKGALLSTLPKQLQEKLEVIKEVYRQQKEMYDNRTNRCDDRIVSISQPHIRPIVRGKEHNPTEFGAKVAIGLVGGYAFITEISWDNIAEASLMPQAAEQYKEMFGFYPKAIIGDGVYPNRTNRDYCKARGIRISGPRLGRKNEEIKRDEARQRHLDSCERNAVEGEFGATKRKYGLDLIMPKLPDTSLTAIAMGVFVANMERNLRLLFVPGSCSFIYYDFQLLSLVISVDYQLAS